MEKICFPKEYRMKKLSEIVLFLLLSAFCVGLAACSSDDDGGISVSGRTLEPYLPDEFSSKKVDALYVKSESGDYPSENVRNYSGTYAFYFFGDKTFVMTAAAEWTQNGQKIPVTMTIYEGAFTKTGDYTNGTLNCTTTYTAKNPFGCAPMPPAPSEITVTGGTFTIQTYEFTKR